MAYQSLWIHYTHWLWLLLILFLREVIRLTREDIRKLLKLADGLNPDHEDGNMTDTYYNTAINEAIRIIAIDCNLIPVLRAFPLQSDVFQYPLEEDVDIIYAFFRPDIRDKNEESCVRIVTPKNRLSGGKKGMMSWSYRHGYAGIVDEVRNQDESPER